LRPLPRRSREGEDPACSFDLSAGRKASGPLAFARATGQGLRHSPTPARAEPVAAPQFPTPPRPAILLPALSQREPRPRPPFKHMQTTRMRFINLHPLQLPSPPPAARHFPCISALAGVVAAGPDRSCLKGRRGRHSAPVAVRPLWPAFRMVRMGGEKTGGDNRQAGKSNEGNVLHGICCQSDSRRFRENAR